MDGDTLKKIKEALLSRKARLGTARDRELHGIQAEQVLGSAEIVDIAQTLEQLDRDKSLEEQERRELRAIENALSRIGSTQFGFCEECEDEIPSRRLLVLPEARLCAKCQTYEERQQSRSRGNLRNAVA